MRKNKEGKTPDHALKDLPVPTLDNFVFGTLRLLLREPELLEAMKKRAAFDGASTAEKLEEKIKCLTRSLGIKKKDIANTLALLTDHPNGPSSELYKEQLDNLSFQKQELEDELEYLREQQRQLARQRPIEDGSYKAILQQFVQQWESQDTDER